MPKGTDKTSVATILLVWLAALGVIFLLPDFASVQKYLLAFGTLVLTIVYLVYSRWDEISKAPRKKLQHAVFAVQTIFFFYVAWVLWSLVVALWQAPPIVNGYTVVTWLALFLVAVALVGVASFYLGVIGIKNWYVWWRENRKKKLKPLGVPSAGEIS